MAEGSAEGRGVGVEYSRKSLEQRREEWIRELQYRQRNIVFPETAMNAGRYWRHLTSRKYPFTTGQKIGFTFILLVSGPGLTAMLFAFTIRLVRSPAEVESWIYLPEIAMAVIADLLLLKASIAVFGKTGSVHEISPSARRNLVMAGKRKA